MKKAMYAVCFGLMIAALLSGFSSCQVKRNVTPEQDAKTVACMDCLGAATRAAYLAAGPYPATGTAGQISAWTAAYNAVYLPRRAACKC